MNLLPQRTSNHNEPPQQTSCHNEPPAATNHNSYLKRIRSRHRLHMNYLTITSSGAFKVLSGMRKHCSRSWRSRFTNLFDLNRCSANMPAKCSPGMHHGASLYESPLWDFSRWVCELSSDIFRWLEDSSWTSGRPLNRPILDETWQLRFRDANEALDELMKGPIEFFRLFDFNQTRFCWNTCKAC